MISSFMLSQFTRKLQHLQRKQKGTVADHEQKQSVTEREWMVVHENCRADEDDGQGQCVGIVSDGLGNNFSIEHLQIVSHGQAHSVHLNDQDSYNIQGSQHNRSQRSRLHQDQNQDDFTANHQASVQQIEQSQNQSHQLCQQNTNVNQQNIKLNQVISNPRYMAVRSSGQNLQLQQNFQVVNPLDQKCDINQISHTINNNPKLRRSFTQNQKEKQMMQNGKDNDYKKRRKPHKLMTQTLKCSYNPQRLPYLYSCNNFILLFQNNLPPTLLKLYLLEMSTQHDIPYNKCLIYLAIECLIYSFYKNHHVDCPIQPKYIISELELMLPQIIAKFAIRNWFVLQKITQGLMTRFKIDSQLVDNSWLFNVVKKNRRKLKENKVEVDVLLGMVNKNSQIQTEIREEPTIKQKQQYQYTTIKSYLTNHSNLFHLASELEEIDYGQFLDCSVREGVKTNLAYYKKLKGLKSNQDQDNKTLNGDLEEDQMKMRDNQGIVSDSESMSYNESQFQLSKVRSKYPPGTTIFQSEEQLYRDQRQQKSDEMLIQNPYQNKSQKKKQKLKQKQKQKQRKKVNAKSKKLSVHKSSTVTQLSVINMDSLQYFKDEQSIRAPDISERQSLQSELSQVHSFGESWNPIDPAPAVLKHKKQKRIKLCSQNPASDPEILVKMDQILYQFYLIYPTFSMQMLEKQISRILGQQLRVPNHLHSEITKKWFNIYKKST